MNFDIKKPIRLSSLGETKQLFYADFEQGFDTYYDWAALVKDTTADPDEIRFLAPSQDASFSSPDFSFQRSDSNRYLDIALHHTAPQSELFTVSNLSSVTPPKNGITMLFMHLSLQADANNNVNRPFFRVVDTNNGIFQEDWNIDGFGDAANTKNPSNITLDFSKPQTATISLVNGGDDGVLLSFVVNGTAYPAHFVEGNNKNSETNDPTTDSLRFLNNNVGFHCFKGQSEGEDVTELSFGYLTADQYLTFSVRRNIDSGASNTTNLYAMSIITTGDIPTAKNIPYTASTVDISNIFTYRPVSSDNTTLLQLIADVETASLNRFTTSFVVNDVFVSAIGRDLDQGCLVEVLYGWHDGDTPIAEFVSINGSSRLLRSKTSTPNLESNHIVVGSALVNVSAGVGNAAPTKIDLSQFPLKLGMAAITWGNARYIRRNNVLIRITGRNPTSTTAPSMHASAVVSGYEKR